MDKDLRERIKHWRKIFLTAGVLEAVIELSKTNQPIRFSELQRSTQLPPKTLINALRALQDKGYVDRISQEEGFPPRVEYQLTPKYQELKPLVDSIVSLIDSGQPILNKIKDMSPRRRVAKQ